MTAPLRPVILVIEDSDDDFYAFERATRGAAVALDLRRCRDGVEARDYLDGATAGAHAWPVLVFLDLNMPGVDGRELLREVKTSEALRKLRVVVYTTSNSPNDIELCYDSHANAFHTKPREFNEMRADLVGILAYWLNSAKAPELAI